MRALRLLPPAIALLWACTEPSKEAAVATATTESAKPKPTSAPTPTPTPSQTAGGAPSTSASVAASYPPLDDACASDADCTTTSQFASCCGGCELRYCSTAFVTRVAAYCAAHTVPCTPQACSWAMAKPQCISGKCQAKK